MKQKGRKNFPRVLKLAGGLLSLAWFGLLAEGAGVEQTNESLSLFLEEGMAEAYAPVLEAYGEAYPEVEVTVETYPLMDAANARQRKNTMLLAGEGPDILFLGGYDNDDVYKLMKSGVFAPLDPYMEADEAYQADQYVQGVMDSGRFDGQQYIIPLAYQTSCLVSSRECLEEIGMDLEACGTFDGLFSQIAALYDTDYSNRVLGTPGSLGGFPDLMGIELLDYNSAEVLLDTEEMRQAMEQYKKMYDEDHSASEFDLDFGLLGQAVLDRQVYLAAGYSPLYTFTVTAGIAEQETPVLIPVPTMDGQTSAVILQSAAVRVNSRNQQNAWNLIRMLLQYQEQGVQYGDYLSVNQNAVDQNIQEAAAQIQENGIFGPGTGGGVSEELIQEYRQLLTAPDRAFFFRSLTGTDLIEDKMAPFFQDHASYEDCMADYINYAKIYLSE